MARPGARFPLLLAAVTAVALAVPAAANAAVVSFSNTGTITAGTAPGANPGAGSPYPSSIALTGLTGTIADANVTLNSFNFAFPDEIDVLLVGPLGQKVMLVSDSCALSNPNGNLTFDDAAAATLADAGPCAPGTFKPSNFADSLGDVSAEMPGAAGAGPYGSLLSAYNGSSPNGTWSLFAQDDRTNDGGTITGGWTLTLDVLAPPATTPTTPTTGPGSAICDELRAKLKKAKKAGKKKKIRKLKKKLKNNNC